MIALVAALLAQIPVPPPAAPPQSITPQIAPDAGVPQESPLQALEPELFRGLSATKLARIQAALVKARLDGWLFADFRHSDEIADRVLGLPSGVPRSRAIYCLIPAQGDPRKLLHAIEPHALDGVPGENTFYTSWRSRDAQLAALLKDTKRIAIDYSPRAEIPTVSRVDAGTVELIKALAQVELVSSAELVAALSSTLSKEELAEQAKAADRVSAALEATAREALRRARNGQPATERELQDYALAHFKRDGLASEGRPVVAVDAHTADPHYSAPETGSAVAAQGSLLLLDFSARYAPRGIYADLTRVYYLGAKPPEEMQRIASIVFAARDAAIAKVREGMDRGVLPTGAEVDAAARSVIARAGYAEAFLHRTGHSITQRDHGEGVNNDDFETHDVRRHLADTCFSIEPGIYLGSKFGIRSEVDVCLPGGRLDLRPAFLQSAITPLQ